MSDKQLAEFRLEDGTTFLIELLDEQESVGFERVAIPSLPGEVVLKAQRTFEDALEQVKPVASVVLEKMKQLNTPATEIDVKFGLKLTVAAGAIFASAGGEVNFEITLRWKQH